MVLCLGLAGGVVDLVAGDAGFVFDLWLGAMCGRLVLGFRSVGLVVTWTLVTVVDLRCAAGWDASSVDCCVC